MQEKSGIWNGLLRDKISLKKLFVFFSFCYFLFKTLYNNIFVLRGVIFAIFFHIKIVESERYLCREDYVAKY